MEKNGRDEVVVLVEIVTEFLKLVRGMGVITIKFVYLQAEIPDALCPDYE